MISAIPKDSNIYYQGGYWNDIPEVLSYMNQRFSGSKDIFWIPDFKERYAERPFNHALFLCCGNDWLERQFIDDGIVLKATAFDYSTNLLKQAKQAKGSRPIRYLQADVNKIDFIDNQFDLIVNSAALHHVQYINRLMRLLLKTIKPNGVFVNFDYIGPRRNQYGFRQWKQIKTVNNHLPRLIRNERLQYPDLPTMLDTDPTEAIHSDLIISTLQRYFKLIERNDVNGGLAYMLLTHNNKIKRLKLSVRKKWVTTILKLDQQLTTKGVVPPLFSYFIAQPTKASLKQTKLNKYYQKIEDNRELQATKYLGCYTLYEYLIVKTHHMLHQMYQSLQILKQRIKNIE